MNIQLILILVGLVIVFFLAFKLLKGLIKAVITVFVIAIVLMVVAGVVIYNDAMVIRQAFQDQKTVVVTHNDELVIAFKMTSDVSLSSAFNQEFYELFSSDELNNISEKLANKDFGDIDEDHFLIIIDQKAFYDREYDFLDLELNFTKEFFEALAVSSTPEEIVLVLESLEGIGDASPLLVLDYIELKTYLYYNFFKTEVKDSKGGFIISEIRNRNVDTRPQLLSIKFFNFFPKSIMERLSGSD